MATDPINQIIYLADILEQCDFQLFWARIRTTPELTQKITGFLDSIRKFVCHVVGITFQSIEQKHLAQLLGEGVFSTKNIRSNLLWFLQETLMRRLCKFGSRNMHGSLKKTIWFLLEIRMKILKLKISVKRLILIV